MALDRPGQGPRFLVTLLVIKPLAEDRGPTRDYNAREAGGVLSHASHVPYNRVSFSVRRRPAWRLSHRLVNQPGLTM
jgi:hypothetical protein